MAPPVPVVRPPTHSPSPAVTAANRISPVNQHPSSDAPSGSKPIGAHPFGEAPIAGANKIQRTIKSSNDTNVPTVPHRHRDENHYIPLYNDYINKNDNNKESNIVNDTTATTAATTNDKDTVKQKSSDDGAKNNSNNETTRNNNCWDNNNINDDVVLRNPTANNKQVAEVRILAY